MAVVNLITNQTVKPGITEAWYQPQSELTSFDGASKVFGVLRIGAVTCASGNMTISVVSGIEVPDTEGTYAPVILTKTVTSEDEGDTVFLSYNEDSPALVTTQGILSLLRVKVVATTDADNSVQFELDAVIK